MAPEPALKNGVAKARELTSLPGLAILPGEELVDPEQPWTVLIMDGTAGNLQLLRETLRSEGYRLLEATRAADGFKILESEKVDLVVLDLQPQETAALEICKQLKSRRQTRLIPILILSSALGIDSEIAGINSGADDFLAKPAPPAVVRARVRAMLRHKAAVDSLEETESIVFALARAVEQRDKVTVGHCERLAALSVTLGMALGLPRSQLVSLHRGGYLHDIGKISVPDAVLFKPGPLTPEEWVVMRAHTTKGEEICRPARTLAPVLPIIRHHHERWNGSGYPDGLSGGNIPLLARILQVADVFDALTSERPYKAAMTAGEALNMLDREVTRGWRDPKIVGLLRRLVEAPRETALMDSLAPWPGPEAARRSLENLQAALLK